MKRLINHKTFIQCVAGVIYRMAPYNKPRDFDKIVEHIKDYFWEHSDNSLRGIDKNDFTCLRIEEDEIYQFIRDCLFGCKEFQNLNLSQEEVDKGILVDDENRPKWVVSGASDGTHLKSYYEFIDLDACIRNIHMALWQIFTDDDLFESKVFLCKKNEKGELELL